jgi:hypothetical protein
MIDIIRKGTTIPVSQKERNTGTWTEQDERQRSW